MRYEPNTAATSPSGPMTETNEKGEQRPITFQRLLELVLLGSQPPPDKKLETFALFAKIAPKPESLVLEAEEVAALKKFALDSNVLTFVGCGVLTKWLESPRGESPPST